MELVVRNGRLESISMFGFSMRRKALPANLAGVDNRGGWWPVIRESFAGAWQSNVAVDTTTILAFPALYACIRLISQDVGKLNIRLMQAQADGLWTETTNPSFSPFLRKPNHYQDWGQFMEAWVASKLIHGNTYVLKQRDNRRVVVAGHVLDPLRCRPLVSPAGDVFYEVKSDDLAGASESGNGHIVVPASEVIHHRMLPLFHPLVGVSPIRACGVAAVQGLKIQDNSALFFTNHSMPGGILSAPGPISPATATTLKDSWEENFGGDNFGKVAVLGDGLKYETMSVNPIDAQLIEQLKMTEEMICTAFGVPRHKVQVGPQPTYNNIEALDIEYLSDCLQSHLVSIERSLDEGLGLAVDGQPQSMAVKFDRDGLLQMDTSTMVKTAVESMRGGMSPNEARKRFYGLAAVEGGETPYMQEQNWPLRLLAARELPTRAPTESAPLPESIDPEKAIREPQADISEAGMLLQKAFEAMAA